MEITESVSVTPSNLVHFPASRIKIQTGNATPIYEALAEEAAKLDKLSKYPSNFNYEVYRDLELRYSDRPIHGGIVKKTSMKLVNSHLSCQQCLYAFEIDTYGRGCVHNCTYCYAKAELTVHGYWNNPIPVPVDINEIRKTFYTVFETDKKSRWREIMDRKIPLRIGCMSDSFMWMDQKFKVTQELLKILSYYNYPYVVFTRSDLVAHDDYMQLIRNDLASVQFSMSSTNDELNRKIEPGAPSAHRRLKALEKLVKNGFWTTVRINPLFPIYPDGYFSDPEFRWEGEVPQFNYSSFEMIDQIADAGVPSVLAGFGRFSRYSMNQIEKACGFDLKPFFNRAKVNKSERDYHFSEKEIRYYYEKLKIKSMKRGVQFTTCYIGNGEEHFWKSRELWDNKADCCNIKGRVAGFKTDAREIPFATRLKYTNHKDSETTSTRLHESLDESITPNIPSIALDMSPSPSPVIQ